MITSREEGQSLSCCAVQVTGATVEGETVKLTVEPAKGGETETIEADVVLVSAGAVPHAKHLSN